MRVTQHKLLPTISTDLFRHDEGNMRLTMMTMMMIMHVMAMRMMAMMLQGRGRDPLLYGNGRVREASVAEASFARGFRHGSLRMIHLFGLLD